MGYIFYLYSGSGRTVAFQSCFGGGAVSWKYTYQPYTACLQTLCKKRTSFYCTVILGFWYWQLKLILIQPLSSISSPDANLYFWLFYDKMGAKRGMHMNSPSFELLLKNFLPLWPPLNLLLGHDHIGGFYFEELGPPLSNSSRSNGEGMVSEMATIVPVLPHMHTPTSTLWTGRVHFPSLLNLG